MMVLLLISIYQKGISPFLPGRCRYYPSCSKYGKEAFETHGFCKALWLTTKRVVSCHPFSDGGHDPVSCKENHHG